MALFVLDTSAISAVLRQEVGYDRVVTLLDRARQDDSVGIMMPFLALMETEYTSLRYRDGETVDRWLHWIASWPAEVVESTSDWRRHAASVKSTYKLSLADAWMAALALLTDAELVHKDPAFDAVPTLKHLRLPYTPPTTRRGRS